MITFENTGEIDILSISSFGVSVKEGNSPIGFFGTGLKYAIAVLLRHNQKISAFVGTTSVDFSIEPQEVRGKTFDFIAMSIDGKKQILGFTTELGKTWQLWMAYRELACNCKDEGGTIAFGDCAAENGKTKFIVRGDLFDAVAQNADQYILSDPPDAKIGSIEIRNREGADFFYRGVKVQTFGKQGLYTYNQTGFLELTEDRTVKHQGTPMYDIARAVLVSTDRQFLRRCLTAHESYLEAHLDYHGWTGKKASKEFLEVVGSCIGSKLTTINDTARKVWQENSHKNFEPVESKLTKVQMMTLDRSISFCKKMQFEVDQYPIKVVESLGDGTLGLALNETIYIAERVFHGGGSKALASTLIEEFLHLRHGWKDMSRELQTYLFDKVVSLGEELNGEPL
jgi:hypothetical protein